jgi:hypothetical protein
MKTWAFNASGLTLGLALTFCWSCFRPKADVKFHIKVKTNQGEQVGDAEIKLGTELLGRSNESGEWTQKLELPAGEKMRLEISKRSEVNYYAPDFLDFIVAKEGTQDLKYDATLYFVPKPSAKDFEKKVQVSGAEVSTTSAGQIPDAAVNPEDSASAKGVKNEDATDTSLVSGAAPGNDRDADDIPDNVKSPEEIGPAVASVDQSPELSTEYPAVMTASPTESPRSDNVSEPSKKAEGHAEISAKVSLGTNLADALDTIEAPASIMQKLPKLILSTIPDTNSSQQNPGKVYPKQDDVQIAKLIYTIQISDGNDPVAGVDIYLGREDKGDLKIGCQTNARGRCVIRFRDVPTDIVKFIARKSGYLTESKSTRVGEKGILRFVLEKGETIDIFAITKNYGFATGVNGVDVYVDGKKVGITDSYGHFSYVYKGNHNDLLEVTLKNSSFLPEEYQSDFVVSGPMALTRYFTPKQPGPARIAILRAQPAGKSLEKELKAFNVEMDVALRRSARTHFFSSNTFVEFPGTNFETELRESGMSLVEVLSNGWQQSDLKGKLDAVVLPTIVTGENPTLEISVIDSTGKTIAAAKEDLESLTDKASIDHSVAAVAKKILQAFPFEGAVLGKKGEIAQINMGKNSNRALHVGDELEVFGNQSAKRGNRTENTKIATLKIERLDDLTSECKILGLAPRAIVDRGDQFIVKRTPTLQPSATPKEDLYVRVSTKSKEGKVSPVGQANIYHDGTWLGATAATGRLYLDGKQFPGAGLLKVIKHGFGVYSKPVKLSAMANLEISLSQESAFLRIESQPTGAKVSIDGEVIGKTPLTHSALVPAGFVKLEIDSPSGYKKFSQIMELEQGTLDLTGPRAIKLEADYKGDVARLLEASKTEDAVARLQEVPETHSDYLAAQHEVGEIYLTMLGNPAKAAAAFSIVTSNPAIHDFNDKRFIGSHIDEGIAVFMTAESLAGQDKLAAVAHYQKAIEILDRVQPFLRFVQKDQYLRGVHNVSFHKALAQHRLWQQAPDQNKLDGVIKNWKDYLDGSMKEVASKDEDSSLLENAKIYFQQAKASQTAKNKSM